MATTKWCFVSRPNVIGQQ